MDMSATLKTLARAGPGPVVSLYLDTPWADEHQRDRVRVFVKNQSRKAAALFAGQLDSDLAWIESQAEKLVAQTLYPDTPGVALFASEARDLRQLVPLAAPCQDSFLVADTPRGGSTSLPPRMTTGDAGRYP